MAKAAKTAPAALSHEPIFIRRTRGAGGPSQYVAVRTGVVSAEAIHATAEITPKAIAAQVTSLSSFEPEELYDWPACRD